MTTTFRQHGRPEPAPGVAGAGGPPGSPAATRGIRVDADGVCLQVRGQQILRDVSLAIAPGELAAIVGMSGAGKTMLLETLAGWRAPGCRVAASAIRTRRTRPPPRRPS
jgi:ABC-type multidrug transport system fused ATPase/permease subunit